MLVTSELDLSTCSCSVYGY